MYLRNTAPDKRPCQYGRNCFITNPSHTILFSHNDDAVGGVVIDLIGGEDDEGGGEVLTLGEDTPLRGSKLGRLKKRKAEGEENKFGDILDLCSYSGGASSQDKVVPAPNWIRPKDMRKQRQKQQSKKLTNKKKGRRRDEDEYDDAFVVGDDDEDDEYMASSALNDGDEDEYDGGGDDGVGGGGDDDDDDVFSNEEDHQCPECVLTFGAKMELEYHMRQDHKKRAALVQENKHKARGGDDEDDNVPAQRLNRLKKRIERSEMPATVAAKAKKEETGPTTLAELLLLCRGMSESLKNKVRDAGDTMITSQPPSLAAGKVLKAHQMQGLNWLYMLHCEKVSGILADDMGLGKTVQVIALLAHLREHRRGEHTALIVVPASVISNWMSEITRWCPDLNVQSYYGSRDERVSLQMEAEDEDDEDDNVDIYLTTYTILINAEDRKWLRKRQCHYLIVDEGHEARTSTSLRHKALTSMRCPQRIILTGTPLHNDYKELLTLLYFLNPSIFLNFRSFTSVVQDGSAKDQESAVPTIRAMLNPFMLRRLKSEVLQLPPKNNFRLFCDLAPTLQESVYKEVLTSNVSKWSKAADDGTRATGARFVNNVMMELRKAASHPLLLPYVAYTREQRAEIAKALRRHVDPYWDMTLDKVEWEIEDWSDFEVHQICAKHEALKEHCLDTSLFSESSGKILTMLKMIRRVQKAGTRLLIFSQMTRLLDIVECVLGERAISYVRLDGQTPVMERQGLIDEFTDDASITVFLLSTKAGGVGINLTAASEVLFLDISFNPQIDRQAEDRAHRIGQEKEVNVYRVLTKETIEEQIYKTHQKKRLIADRVLESGGGGGGGATLDEGGEAGSDVEASVEQVSSILRKYLMPHIK